MRFSIYGGTPGVFSNEDDTVLLVLREEGSESFEAELVASPADQEGVMRLNTYNVAGQVEYMDGFDRRAICAPHMFDHLGHVPLFLKVVGTST